MTKRFAWAAGRLLFLVTAPITIPAHLQWMLAISRTHETSPVVTSTVSVAIVYVVYRVLIDLVTDVYDLTLRRRGMEPYSTDTDLVGKYKMSWREYLLIAWFNLGETTMAVVTLCAIIYGMTILLHPPNPDYFYAIQFGRPLGLWTVALSFAACIGPLAIFKALENSVLPLPYRWLGGKLLDSTRIEYPWQR